MLFGTIDLGRFAFTANSLNNGAREAARFASVFVPSRRLRRPQPDRLRDEDRPGPGLGGAGSAVTVTVTCERYTAAGVKTIHDRQTCRTDDFLVVHTETTFTLVTPLIGQFLGNQKIAGDSRVTVNQ